MDTLGQAYVTGNFGVRSFNSTGTQERFFANLVPYYSTSIGGSDGYDIALDAFGSAYVTGRAGSLTPDQNSFQPNNAGGADAFIAKLNQRGAIVWATYLGGSGQDIGTGIALDPSGNIYVTGNTRSANFPTSNAFQTTFGGEFDVFITAMNLVGTALLYSTYLSDLFRLGNESGYGIAIDSAGNAYVAGVASTPFFRPTPGVVQTAFGGGGDRWICRQDWRVQSGSIASFSVAFHNNRWRFALHLVGGWIEFCASLGGALEWK